MTAAMEDRLWREIGALESESAELRAKVDAVAHDVAALQRRRVRVVIIDGLFRLAWLFLLFWLLWITLGWLDHRAGNNAITAYCI